MDALVLAHTAALHLAFQHCPAECSAADVLMNNWRCPDICLPVAVAAGAAAVVQLADDRQKKQTYTHPSLPQQHAMLASLQAEERRQAEQGPEQRAALALRIERAKTLRPWASLACPHLAADPQLRGKLCTGCRTVR
ncbi:hypothetical protein COHA_007078 [Chlorella ohadii]|uniref:Uncharacterized protein n=1 Tax=Chlorella ohadii TaxID=2649997 RepID=A0AAD5DRL1_9CHLO|nr:hypothetical protein COHA_007078 [Chlorella ohadii]